MRKEAEGAARSPDSFLRSHHAWSQSEPVAVHIIGRVFSEVSYIRSPVVLWPGVRGSEPAQVAGTIRRQNAVHRTRLTVGERLLRVLQFQATRRISTRSNKCRSWPTAGASTTTPKDRILRWAIGRQHQVHGNSKILWGMDKVESKERILLSHTPTATATGKYLPPPLLYTNNLAGTKYRAGLVRLASSEAGWGRAAQESMT